MEILLPRHVLISARGIIHPLDSAILTRAIITMHQLSISMVNIDASYKNFHDNMPGQFSSGSQSIMFLLRAVNLCSHII